MSIEIADLQMRRSLLRSEFDKLMYRKNRIDERLDDLARQIERYSLEIAVLSVRRDAHKEMKFTPPTDRRPLAMVIE